MPDIPLKKIEIGSLKKKKKSMVKKRESNNESYINIQSPPADPIFVYDETLPLINLNGQSNYNPKDHMMTMPK